MWRAEKDMDDNNSIEPNRTSTTPKVSENNVLFMKSDTDLAGISPSGTEVSQ